LLAVGVAGVLRGGFPNRFDPLIADIDNYNNYNYRNLYRAGTCFLQPPQLASDYREDQCFATNPDKRSVLLWGDSVAAHYYPGLSSMLEETNVLQANMSSCPPFPIDINIPVCNDFNERIFYLLKLKHPDAIILSGQWEAYQAALGYLRFSSVLNGIIDKIHGVNSKLVLFGPSIRYTEPLPKIIATGGLAMNTGASEFVFAGLFELDQRMEMDFSKTDRVRYVSILNAACVDRVCPVFATKSVPMEWDALHLTAEGSQFVISRILPQLVSKLANR
jgi:hypothetical protein